MVLPYVFLSYPLIIFVLKSTKQKNQILMSASPRPMHLLLFYSLFSVLYDLVLADFPYNVCSSTVVSTTNTQFSHNLDNLLLSLSSNAPVSNFYNTSIGSDPDKIYGLLFCYKNVTKPDCKRCIELAREDIQRFCPRRNEGVVWEEWCQLRYSNLRFIGHLDISRNQFQANPKNGTFEPDRFRSVVNVLLNNLTKKAAFVPSAGMYATGTIRFTDTDTIYALVQCTIDLSPTDCNTCLEIARSNVSTCCYFSRGARLLSPSCYLRYEFYDFIRGKNSTDNQSTNSKKSSSKNHWLIPVLAIGSAIIVAAFLGSSVYCYAARNQSNKEENQISSQEVQLHNIGDPYDENFLRQISLRGRENLNPQDFPFFDLASLYAATNNFSDSNKLGQGGFGPVYKGILADGLEVAVKRLSVSSEQGLEEFINEVLLVLKLQHKNLVRLLGFCIDGEEKLLIYEYMPNGSLDIFLFDCRKCMQLNWNIRLNIINGIARGMLYLHEDSRLRIIHRDLKASNVLLDNEMNPKISDFGMARIFGGTNGDATTAKIVGTYGYIAPEFAMEGLYSIKSDVFSFGVLLLEILSGKRNSGFHISKLAPSLLAYAWKLWNEAKGLELMDPLLNDSCCIDEFLKYMHIGLLCVQEDAYDRPAMSSVVVMLRSEAVTPLQPKRPAFSIGRFADHYELNDHISSSVNGLTDSSVLAR